MANEIMAQPVMDHDFSQFTNWIYRLVHENGFYVERFLEIGMRKSI